HGLLKWQGHSIFVSEALCGWSVGLDPQEDGLIDVYFADLLVGQLEPATHSFLRAASGPQEAVVGEPSAEAAVAKTPNPIEPKP
ncbi:MAG TPA: hypothetical protein VGE39_01915, partial [Prosthecobacter sp.]